MMNQNFYLRNIDKSQSVLIGRFKDGRFDHRSLPEYLTHSQERLEWSWAGAQLILLGDCAGDVPALWDHKDEAWGYYAYSYEPNDSTNSRKEGYGSTSVLRNLSTREYIRAELFPCASHSSTLTIAEARKVVTDGSKHVDLSELLLLNIVWSSRPLVNATMIVEGRGAWAGARFDIVELDSVKDEKSWKDATEAHFFKYFNLWNVVTCCSCHLCRKYCDEEQGFKKKLEADKNLTMFEDLSDTEDDHTPPRIATPQRVHSLGPAHLSPFETLPVELEDEIFAYLRARDVKSCAAASSTLGLLARKHLYSSVKLSRAHQTPTLLETLSRRPELAGYIKKLYLVTRPHWKSLQIVHGILKQLPALKILGFAACWFSYGDLPCWKYPFTLHALTWGLKMDAAYDRFCQAQPNAKVTLVQPVYKKPAYQEMEEDEDEEDREEYDEEEYDEEEYKEDEGN